MDFVLHTKIGFAFPHVLSRRFGDAIRGPKKHSSKFSPFSSWLLFHARRTLASKYNSEYGRPWNSVNKFTAGDGMVGLRLRRKI